MLIIKPNLDITFGKHTHTRGLHVKGDPQNINWGYAAKTAGFGVNANNESFFDVNYNDEETPHTKWKSNNMTSENGTIHHFSSAVWVLLKEMKMI